MAGADGPVAFLVREADGPVALLRKVAAGEQQRRRTFNSQPAPGYAFQRQPKVWTVTMTRRLLAIGELADAEDQSQEVSQIILFDQGTPKGIPEDPRVQLRVGDIADPAQGQQLVDEDGMVIFHLASVMSGQGEKDFDLCWRVNMEGTRNLLEACRRRRGCKFIFASSGACFGERPPGPETDGTKLLPETSYEPLWKRDCILPLPPDLRHAVCGYRVLVRNLIHLANLPAAAFESSDRCMNLPCLSVTLHDLHEALKRIVDPSKLGQVSYAPDEALAAKLRTFHHDMDAERARRLGMVGDSSAAAIAADFAAEYVDEALLKPVMEIFEEPRHWRTFGNEYVNVYRVEPRRENGRSRPRSGVAARKMLPAIPR
eukprot:g29859.t1